MSRSHTILTNALPIFIIGAGGIVSTAHLPAYRIAGYEVKGIYDIDVSKAAQAVSQFGAGTAFNSLDELVAQANEQSIIDIAVPAGEVENLLARLPERSNVLLQKPLGEDLAAAKRIAAITKEKQMTAAVNFQLRYAPAILEVRRILDNDEMGELLDIEININVYTPWHLWKFLYHTPRVEILYHSIHYIDLVRSFFGNPQSIYAKTVGHPGMPDLASVRSSIIMDYGNYRRANILTNHCHGFGPDKQQSTVKFEFSEGAVIVGLGVLQNYPIGEPDSFDLIKKKNITAPTWQSKKIEGTWFPHAFIGSMEQVMLAVTGRQSTPGNSVDDALHTMACVEAAYQSSAQGGVEPDFSEA